MPIEAPIPTRVRQRRACAQRASYLTAVIESTQSLLWVVDLECRLTLFNRAFADSVSRLFNVKVQDGMKPSDILSQERAVLWPPLFKQALREGGFRTDYRTIDGRWLELAFDPVIENGKKVGVSVVGRDVTDRRLAEEARKSREARLHTVIYKAPIGILIHRDRISLFANQKWLDMHGLEDSTEVVGRPVENWLAPAGRCLAEERARMRRCGVSVPEEYESMALRADGSEFPVQVMGTEVHLEDGQAKLVFMTDISQRRTSEEALRASEARFRGYFDLPLVGMALTSPENGFIAANDRFCEILGYPREELTGINWIELTHPDDRDAELVQFVRLLAGEIDTYSLDKRFIRKDGLTVWTVMSIGCVRKPDGKVDTICSFLDDITASKVAKATLQKHIRELKLLSEINASLLKAHSEHELLEDYCRIIVETGGYKMAWVGFPVEADDKPVQPVACFGDNTGYLKRVHISWAEIDRGMGPVGRAIRSGRIQYSEDIATDPNFQIWRRHALKAGFRSVIAVPFHQSDGEWACLMTYGAEPMPWSDAEQKLMEQVASALGFGIKSLRTAIAKEQYQRDLHSSLEQTIQVIADTVDQRDPYTAGHQRRVGDLCMQVARKMGMDEDRVRGLALAATIHDLGKIAIPAEILAKPGRLTPIQFSLVKEHVQLGYEIIKDVRFPWPIREMIQQHHERMDGSGYPMGLKGHALLPESRILMVADVVEAMTNHRPYRAARGIEIALEEIDRGRGSKFDEATVDAFLDLFRKDGYQLPD